MHFFEVEKLRKMEKLTVQWVARICLLQESLELPRQTFWMRVINVLGEDMEGRESAVSYNASDCKVCEGRNWRKRSCEYLTLKYIQRNVAAMEL